MKNVVIYTKDWCFFCKAAKQLLDRLGISYEEIDVTHDALRYQEMVDRADGRTTVPQIFIDGEGIGGCNELYALVDNNLA